MAFGITTDSMDLENVMVTVSWVVVTLLISTSKGFEPSSHPMNIAINKHTTHTNTIPLVMLASLHTVLTIKV